MKTIQLLGLILLLSFSPALAGGTKDYSGPITTNATSQTLVSAIPQRSYLLFQNISADTLWISINANATQDSPSIKFVAGALFEWRKNTFIPTEKLAIIGPNAGAKF